MKLVEFRITNYRSINDSGPISVEPRTALVGRNESGKSNLLLALRSLNPSGGMQALSDVKDFPRDRPLSEFSIDTPVVDTVWELTEEEQSELGKIFPRAKTVTEVSVCRYYRGDRRDVEFRHLPALLVTDDDIKLSVKKIQSSITTSLQRQKTIEETPLASEQVLSAFESLKTALSVDGLNQKSWAVQSRAALSTFRQALTTLKCEIPTAAENGLESLETLSNGVLNDEKELEQARAWILQRLPVFIYLSDYPALEGHQSISQFLQSKNNGPLTEAHENFEKLCKVAGLDPSQLNQLLQQDHEKRILITNRAGAVITRKIRELWKDRALKVRFNLDADHLDTLISDPTSVYEIEVNLDERSRGFKWFFSFYITFTADTAGGPAANAILLLDEPGLYLHALAQEDLLNHFARDFKNQIIFTTHSPFMVPVDELDCVRTVNISQDTGTVVSNDPIGDERTLFPLQTAIGYGAAQSLFIGQNNLVVEGVSDFWYLSAVSDYLNENSGSGLPRDLVITPAGGAQRVSYMVSLMSAHRLKVLVLLDDEQESRLTAGDLAKSKLIRMENILFVSEGFSAPQTGGADIEDLLDPNVFHGLVTESYARELAKKTLKLNDHIPRIVKRYEEAFNALNIPFHKPRIARLFLQHIATKPDEVLPEDSRTRFETLFNKTSERLKALMSREDGPFR